ncbi:hypothetical protein LPJ53_002571 [Coemansia erecta]|uniref:Uncharacterized protein n=1 Tax=Coemansia erecta TaxID=147472 RepID=A0A9W7Y2J9_9FUNG|nr:hypothetical protein LPJ53_002571 [Coemansia erecta]
MNNVNTIVDNIPDVVSVANMAGPTATPAPGGAPPNNQTVSFEETGPPKGPEQSGQYGPGGFPQYPQQQLGNGNPGGWQINPYANQGPNMHAGPMRQRPGNEMSEYEINHNPAYRPPPNQHGDFSSDSSSSIGQPYAHAHHGGKHHGQNKPPPKYSFLNCLKDSIKHIEYMELLPIAGVLGASLYHHFKHRGSQHVVPFKEPSWVKYLGNIAFAHNAYGMVKHRPGGGGGGGGGIPWTGILSALAGSAMASGVRPGFGGGGNQGYGRPPHQRPGIGQQYGRPNQSGYGSSGGFGGFGGGGGGGGGGGDMVTKVLGKILGTLFKGGNTGVRTRDLESGAATDIFSTFDDSYALQRVVAEHYYKHIYLKHMDLRQASAQMLAGAAAICVLRKEPEIQQQLGDSWDQMPEGMTFDQMIMGCVMSEVEELLALKMQQGGMLDPEDTLENVGRMALATVIKIKMDEEKGVEKSQSAAEESWDEREDGVHRTQSVKYAQQQGQQQGQQHHRSRSHHHHPRHHDNRQHNGQGYGESQTYDYGRQPSGSQGFNNDYNTYTDPYQYQY